MLHGAQRDDALLAVLDDRGRRDRSPVRDHEDDLGIVLVPIDLAVSAVKVGFEERAGCALERDQVPLFDLGLDAFLTPANSATPVDCRGPGCVTPPRTPRDGRGRR